ncbi:hypothetical protein [Planctomycetes bacterium K23_9]
MVLSSAFVAASGSFAQESKEAEANSRSGLFDDSEKSPRSSLSTDPAQIRAERAVELRQARALYRSQQRIERLERNAWIGYEPLRPTWNSVPMMSSRYNYRRTIYVPVYSRVR